MDYILETRKICHRYSRKTDSYALKDVSIGIRKGVRTAILGANGAGKSTLFYHLNGILKPESGEVFYRGKTLSYKKDHLYQLREDISVVVQNPDEQIFSSTVEEDVAFGPMNLNLHPDIVEQRIRDSLFKVGMEEETDHPAVVRTAQESGHRGSPCDGTEGTDPRRTDRRTRSPDVQRDHGTD